MPLTTSEADIIFSRANVALAKSQRLIASWLPVPTTGDASTAKTAEELDKEERELFQPMPELLGLGAPLPKEIKDGDFKRQDISSNDRLRKQLLGKDFMKLYGKNGYTGASVVGPLGSKPLPVGTKVAVDEDDDEGGRSTLGRSKRKRDQRISEAEHGYHGEGSRSEHATAGPAKEAKSSTSQGRASNYLDEVLAEKERKRRKKKRKAEKVDEAEDVS